MRDECVLPGTVTNGPDFLAADLAKLSSAVEQTADHVIITDRNGIIEYVNPAFEAATGYTRQEAIGQTPRILKSDQHDDGFYLRLWATILSGQTFRAEFTNRKKDGSLYYEAKTITPIRDGNGHITHFVSTGRDITERVQAFQAMERRVAESSQELAQLYEQAEARRRELEALYRADEYLHRHLRLDQVLQALVDVVVEILGADKASVQVWDPQVERLLVRAARGYSQEMIAVMSGYRPGDGIAGHVFLTGRPMAIEDARFAPPPADHIAGVEDIRSVLSVPLTIGGQIFGVFAMDYCQPRTFSADDRRLFLALAQRAARAIKNARLYEQAAQVAVLQERQRLARELHDSVTQSLYSVVLLAEAGRRFAEGGDLQHASQVLSHLGQTGQQALREMRLMVYEMRPLALQGAGLVGALQHRLDAVEKRAGIHSHLHVKGRLALPGPLEEDLYRIAQEALNNSLKHAEASQVVVTIAANEPVVELEVSDDGKGFDLPPNGEHGGMGIATMRERAARLGAQLIIDSRIGQGTCVRIRVQHPQMPLPGRGEK